MMVVVLDEINELYHFDFDITVCACDLTFFLDHHYHLQSWEVLVVLMYQNVILMNILSFMFYFQCLCLAPTYELALQIGEVTKEMSKYMEGLQITFAVRGGDRGEEIYQGYDLFSCLWT